MTIIRINRSRGATCAAVMAVCCLGAGGSAHAAESPVTWDGGASSDNWTDADNWNPGTVGGPCNVGPVEFLVTIGCTAPGCNPVTSYDPVFFNDDTPPVCEITDFSLDNNSRLVLEIGRAHV